MVYPGCKLGTLCLGVGKPEDSLVVSVIFVCSSRWFSCCADDLYFSYWLTSSSFALYSSSLSVHQCDVFAWPGRSSWESNWYGKLLTVDLLSVLLCTLLLLLCSGIVFECIHLLTRNPSVTSIVSRVYINLFRLFCA